MSLGHHFLPPFATKGGGENLLRVKEQGTLERTERDKVALQIRSFSFLLRLVSAKMALRGSESFEVFDNEQ